MNEMQRCVWQHSNSFYVMCLWVHPTVRVFKHVSTVWKECMWNLKLGYRFVYISAVGCPLRWHASFFLVLLSAWNYAHIWCPLCLVCNFWCVKRHFHWASTWNLKVKSRSVFCIASDISGAFFDNIAAKFATYLFATQFPIGNLVRC